MGSRQYVTASHISNNIPTGSKCVELGKDAKNLYYISSPASCTLIVPPSNFEVKEAPIREAAAKLGTNFTLYTNRALDDIPIQPSSFDAALCFDMLQAAPRDVANAALLLLVSSLRPGGRMLFLESERVELPALCRELGLRVEYDTEGGFDVGIITRGAGTRTKEKRASKAKKGPSKASLQAMADKGGFGSAAAQKKKKKKKTEKELLKEEPQTMPAASLSTSDSTPSAQAEPIPNEVESQPVEVVSDDLREKDSLPPGWYTAVTDDGAEYFYNAPSAGEPQISCWLREEAWAHFEEISK